MTTKSESALSAVVASIIFLGLLWLLLLGISHVVTTNTNVKIIKPGNLPSLRIHNLTCPNCGCVFEITEAEVRTRQHATEDFRGDPYTETIRFHQCPQSGCGRQVSVPR